MTWRSRAACLEQDPELFFPIGNTNPAFRQIERAKVVCGGCDVAQTCLNWAMETRQDDGDGPLPPRRRPRRTARQTQDAALLLRPPTHLRRVHASSAPRCSAAAAIPRAIALSSQSRTPVAAAPGRVQWSCSRNGRQGSVH